MIAKTSHLLGENSSF